MGQSTEAELGGFLIESAPILESGTGCIYFTTQDSGNHNYVKG